MFTGFDDPLSLGITVFRFFFWGGGCHIGDLVGNCKNDTILNWGARA